jgi:hypothetical protein
MRMSEGTSDNPNDRTRNAVGSETELLRLIWASEEWRTEARGNCAVSGTSA